MSERYPTATAVLPNPAPAIEPQLDPHFTPPGPPGDGPSLLPTLDRTPALVPARMINEALYCERLLYLEWVQGEFTDNFYTVDGRFAHRRADVPGGTMPPVPGPATSSETGTIGPAADGTPVDALPAAAAPEVAKAAPRKEPAKRPRKSSKKSAGDDEEESPAAAEPLPYKARSLWLSSEKIGITAKIDVVEGDATGTVVPIEYKRGHPPDPERVPEGAWLPERAQVCAQVLLLREHGFRCEEGALYFAAARRRVKVDITDALIDATRTAVMRARTVTAQPEIPPPLVDSPKCNGCSLVGICLPDETNFLKREAGLLRDEPEPEPAPEFLDSPDDELFGERLEPRASPRRLVPARDDKQPLYVQDQGGRIGLDGQCLSVKPREGNVVTARLAHTSQVNVMGNVQVSSQALRAMLERGIPLSFFSTGGWYYGRAIGHDPKNVELRIAQWRASTDPAFCLTLARGIVAAKIRNCRTLLRRNHPAPDDGLLDELERIAKRAEAAGALESLLGLEGTAARMYFGAFAGMFKQGGAGDMAFDLDGRNRRPPRDPVNAMLSFCYSMLAKDFTVTLSAVGLDPMLGFYHQLRFGRPSLALDLMEEFRPLIADSVVLSAINNGVFSADDFVRAAGSVALVPAARRRLIEHYERRMDQLVTHPVFDYRISYRRVFEVQARLLSRLLLGEVPDYPSFRTR